MKAASFFSVAFMAATAIAAPFQTEGRSIDNSVKDITRTAGGVVGGTVATVSKVVQTKRDITDAAGLISTLKSVTGSLGDPLSALNDITKNVNTGDLPKDDATAQATPQLEEIEEILKNLVSELTDAAGLNVRDSDLDTVVSLVNVLVGQVLTTVSGLVTILGLRPQLNSILASVLGLVAKVLALLIGLVAGLVPGLVAGLSPLLAGLGNGLLAPLLTPIAALLAGLQLPGVPVV